jgi:hypothetical protein
VIFTLFGPEIPLKSRIYLGLSNPKEKLSDLKGLLMELKSMTTWDTQMVKVLKRLAKLMGN